jgi:hypothetical protein
MTTIIELQKPAIAIWPAKLTWSQLEGFNEQQLLSLYRHYHHDHQHNDGNAAMTTAQLLDGIRREIAIDLTDPTL